MSYVRHIAVEYEDDAGLELICHADESNDLIFRTKGKPMTETAADETLLQESDVPEIPAVLLIDLSSIAHPIWHMSQKESDPDSHQPAHGGGRAVAGGGSSAHSNLL